MLVASNVKRSEAIFYKTLSPTLTISYASFIVETIMKTTQLIPDYSNNDNSDDNYGNNDKVGNDDNDITKNNNDYNSQ